MRSYCFIAEIFDYCNMEYKSKPTGRPADFYMLGLVLTGGVFWSLTYFQKALTALYQLCAVVMVGVAMYLLIRYRLTIFCLRIECKNGVTVDMRTAIPEELDFVAERVQGRKTVPLARLSLSELKRAERVRYEELREAAADASLYKYYADMSPEEGCLLVFSEAERDIAIFTELSPVMFTYIRKIAAERGAE